nr:hypothetical protein BaRGS_009892 [Batillaria attramentaria]
MARAGGPGLLPKQPLHLSSESSSGCTCTVRPDNDHHAMNGDGDEKPSGHETERVAEPGQKLAEGFTVVQQGEPELQGHPVRMIGDPIFHDRPYNLHTKPASRYLVRASLYPCDDAQVGLTETEPS